MNAAAKIIFVSTMLLALTSCEKKTESTASVGAISVDSGSEMATGEAFGIEFKAAGASGVEVETELAGAPGSPSRAEITLADDLKMTLKTSDGGETVIFEMNGRDLGVLTKGDVVEVADDRSVTVNGERRVPIESGEVQVTKKSETEC